MNARVQQFVDKIGLAHDNQDKLVSSPLEVFVLPCMTEGLPNPLCYVSMPVMLKIQNQFDNFELHHDFFLVDLWFNKTMHRVGVPYRAITYVKFDLEAKPKIDFSKFTD